jgi:hypothetical protein
MSTSVNVHERSPLDRTRGYAERGTASQRATCLSVASAVSWRAGIGVLIALGFVWMAVGTIYLDSLAGLVDPQSLGEILGP